MIAAGLYYGTPEGGVAYVGGTTSAGMVHYCFADGKGQRHVNEAGVAGWKPLDIREFPGTKDKTLPYTFDLVWDVKHMSGLVYMILHKESLQGMSFDAEDAMDVLGYLDSPGFWQGCNLDQKDFNRIRRCLRLSFGLSKMKEVQHV